MAFTYTVGYPNISLKDREGKYRYRRSGYPLAVQLKSKDLDFGDKRRYKMVDGLHIFADELKAPETIQVILRSKQSLREDYDAEDIETLPEDESPIFFRQSGMYHSVEIRANNLQVFFKISRIMFHGTPAGQKF